MKEYIEREQALKAFCFWCAGNVDLDDDEPCSCLGKKEILDVPTADVVEVVRCCNCQYFKTNINKENYCDIHSTTWDKFYVRYDDYCSYGIRTRGG